MPWSIVSTRYTNDDTVEVLDVVCRKSKRVAGITDVYLENANRSVRIASVLQLQSLLGKPWVLCGEVDPKSTLADPRYIYPRVSGFLNRRYAIIERLKQMGIYQRDVY